MSTAILSNGKKKVFKKKDYSERTLYNFIRPTSSGLFLTDTNVGGHLISKFGIDLSGNDEYRKINNVDIGLDNPGLGKFTNLIAENITNNLDLSSVNINVENLNSKFIGKDVPGCANFKDVSINNLNVFDLSSINFNSKFIGKEVPGYGSFKDVSMNNLNVTGSIISSEKIKAPVLEIDELKYVYQSSIDDYNLDLSGNLEINGDIIVHNNGMFFNDISFKKNVSILNNLDV